MKRRGVGSLFLKYSLSTVACRHLCPCCFATSNEKTPDPLTLDPSQPKTMRERLPQFFPTSSLLPTPSFIPHPSSLIPHPSSLIPHPFTMHRVVVLFLASAGLSGILSYFLLDSRIQQYTASINLRGDFDAILIFTGFMGSGVFCAFVLATIWFFDPPRRKMTLFILTSVLLAVSISTSIKHLVERPRPATVAGLETDVDESMFSRSELQSFPSGHTTMAFALASSLALLYPHARGYLFTLATLVGLQRIIKQAHYPTDVIAGAMIGVLSVYLVSLLLARISRLEQAS